MYTLRLIVLMHLLVLGASDGGGNQQGNGGFGGS